MTREMAMSRRPGLASWKWLRFCWNKSVAGAPARNDVVPTGGTGVPPQYGVPAVAGTMGRRVDHVAPSNLLPTHTRAVGSRATHACKTPLARRARVNLPHAWAHVLVCCCARALAVSCTFAASRHYTQTMWLICEACEAAHVCTVSLHPCKMRDRVAHSRL